MSEYFDERKNMPVPEPPVYNTYVPYAPDPPERVWLHIVLFLATVYTTTFAGMLMSDLQGQIPPDDWTVLFDPRYLISGLPFSITLLAILGIHEMGHYLAARHWGVKATLPYFIPFPLSLIGTLGAVIKLRSRMPNRRALIDIGAWGPLSGFVVAVVALGIGLTMSEVVATRGIPAGSMSLGDSLLSAWIGQLVVGDLPEGYDVMLHPIAFAGWLGLFVTVLNLLPMGQFDGGHIVYAIFGHRHILISRLTLIGLVLFWAFGPPYDWWHEPSMFSAWETTRWPGWLIWMLMALFMGRQHPPTENPFVELDPPRRWIGYISLAIFVLCFIPIPIQVH